MNRRGSSSSMLGRPAGRRGRVGREVGEVDPPDRRQVVVAEEAELAARARLRRAAIRLRAVADEVAETPHLVGTLLLEIGEDHGERVPVGMDVRDNRDSQ